MSSDEQPSDEALDALLRGLPVEEGEPSLDVAELLAYRAGRLSDEDRARVEARLADSPEDRGLLAELMAPANASAVERAVAARRPSRRREWWLAAAAVLLIGVGVGLVVSRTGPGRALPSYSMEAPAGLGQVRSDAAARGDLFLPHTPVKLLLTPSADVTDVAAHVFVAQAGGALRAVQVPAARGPTGVLRVERPAEDFFGRAPGDWTIYVVVAPADLSLDLAGRSPADARSRAVDLPWLEARIRYALELPEGSPE